MIELTTHHSRQAFLSDALTRLDEALAMLDELGPDLGVAAAHLSMAIELVRARAGALPK